MARRLTTEEFIARSRKVHGYKYDYSLVDYKGALDKVQIICKIHGLFEQRPASHMKKEGCSACGKDVGGRKRISNEEFISRASEIHKGLYDYNLVNIDGSESVATIICKLHGEFSQKVGVHLAGSGCPECGKRKAKRALLTKEEFIERSTLKHGQKYDYSLVEIKGALEKVKILCKKHGEFLQTPSSHMFGSGCRKCGVPVSKITKDEINKLIAAANKRGVFTAEGQEIDKLDDKYLFRHECGRTLLSTARSVLVNGSGCRYCSSAHTYESLSSAISEKHNNEILLISKDIAGIINKYRFQHSCGHEWYATANSILNGSGCPKCAISGCKTDKPATFYILKIHGDSEFTGFGISNVYKNRKSQHTKNLKARNCSIVSEILIESEGETIQNLENYVKQTLQCRNSSIEGFRTESVLISPEELKIFCEEWLTANNVSYKIPVTK